MHDIAQQAFPIAKDTTVAAGNFHTAITAQEVDHPFGGCGISIQQITLGRTDGVIVEDGPGLTGIVKGNHLARCPGLAVNLVGCRPIHLVHVIIIGIQDLNHTTGIRIQRFGHHVTGPVAGDIGGLVKSRVALEFLGVDGHGRTGGRRVLDALHHRDQRVDQSLRVVGREKLPAPVDRGMVEVVDDRCGVGHRHRPGRTNRVRTSDRAGFALGQTIGIIVRIVLAGDTEGHAVGHHVLVRGIVLLVGRHHVGQAGVQIVLIVIHGDVTQVGVIAVVGSGKNPLVIA